MKKILSDLRDARIMLLNIKISIDAAMDDPGADADVLSDALDKLDEAYDALCETSEILDP